MKMYLILHEENVKPSYIMADRGRLASSEGQNTPVFELAVGGAK